MSGDYIYRINRLIEELDEMKEKVDEMVENIDNLDDENDYKELLAMRDDLEDISNALDEATNNLRYS